MARLAVGDVVIFRIQPQSAEPIGRISQLTPTSAAFLDAFHVASYDRCICVGRVGLALSRRCVVRQATASEARHYARCLGETAP